MPTEPMRRYFQVASSERGFWLKYRNGAHTRVVASIATHIKPRWWDSVTRVIVASAANKLAQKIRFGLSVRRDKYPGTYSEERKNRTLRNPSTTLPRGSRSNQPPRPEIGP